MAVNFASLIFNRLNTVFDGEIRFEAKKTDLNDPACFEELRDELAGSRNQLMMWMSETWSHWTDQPRVQGNQVRWIDQTSGRVNIREREKDSDPFMTVLDHSIAYLPDFLARVRSGEMYMFPNVIAGDMDQRGYVSRFRMRSGGKILLPPYPALSPQA
jgi:hypothetical protein